MKLIKSLALSAALPFVAGAQQSAPLVSNVTNLTGFVLILCTIVNWLFTFLIILAIVMILVAAYKYLTASGDPEKVKSASHVLIYVVVAVAVAVLAKGLPLLVGSIFGATFQGC